LAAAKGSPASPPRELGHETARFAGSSWRVSLLELLLPDGELEGPNGHTIASLREEARYTIGTGWFGALRLEETQRLGRMADWEKVTEEPWKLADNVQRVSGVKCTHFLPEDFKCGADASLLASVERPIAAEACILAHANSGWEFYVGLDGTHVQSLNHMKFFENSFCLFFANYPQDASCTSQTLAPSAIYIQYKSSIGKRIRSRYTMMQTTQLVCILKVRPLAVFRSRSSFSGLARRNTGQCQSQPILSNSVEAVTHLGESPLSSSSSWSEYRLLTL
jgi:hypothetical protein